MSTSFRRLATIRSQIQSYSTMSPTPKHYEFLVIGGGSGGVATARRAASYGAKTLLIEGNRMGGTCVNVGCVPKKVMWNASDLANKLKHATNGYNFGPQPAEGKFEFDWAGFKAKRDAYIKRLNGIYERNLTNEGVEYVYGWAEFVDPHTVHVKLRDGGEAVYSGEHVLIATGGKPRHPTGIEGAELGIDSDGFFELETQPESVAIVGAGYIAVELAGVFNGLGSQTHLVIRHDSVLRNFDDIIGTTLTSLYEKHGVHVHKQSQPTRIVKLDNGKLEVTIETGSNSSKVVVDKLIWAVGREPLEYSLNLAEIGIKRDGRGKIVVDEYQNTNIPKVYSLGDLAEDIELTPVAIAAGRKLGDRLFGGKPESKLDYTNIPSAIFSHPEAASIGLSEAKAREQYGNDQVKVYQSKFINMYYSPLDPEDKDPAVYKLVVTGPEEKVVGLHLVGDASSEILQGFGVAVKMGATKADFDSCVAIHPTAAEEIVTLK